MAGEVVGVFDEIVVVTVEKRVVVIDVVVGKSHSQLSHGQPSKIFFFHKMIYIHHHSTLESPKKQLK